MHEPPNFEKAQNDQDFKRGDDVYYIDKNKYDIYLANILKKNENNFIVEFKDHDANPKKVSIDRILPITPTNDSIYEEQKELREKHIAIEKEKKKKKKLSDDEQNDEQDNDQDNWKDKHKKHAEKNESKEINKKKKKKKLKAPIIDYNTIVSHAWKNGIQTPEKFKKYVKKNIKELYERYQQFYDSKINETDDQSLFMLGGYELNDKSDEKEVSKFWSQAKSLWNKLFGDLDSVEIHKFNKKLVELMKLPRQTESNAREAIEYFFSSDGETQEIKFISFCAFLALFSPYKTAFRKIRDVLKIPPEYIDMIEYHDPIEVVEEDHEVEMNCFEINQTTDKPIIVYNLPHVPYGKEYLIDGNGVRYKTWNEFFSKNQIIPSSNPKDLPHEENNDGDDSMDDNGEDEKSEDDIDSIIEEELNQNEDSNEDNIDILKKE